MRPPSRLGVILFLSLLVLSGASLVLLQQQQADEDEGQQDPDCPSSKIPMELKVMRMIWAKKPAQKEQSALHIVFGMRNETRDMDITDNLAQSVRKVAALSGKLCTNKGPSWTCSDNSMKRVPNYLEPKPESLELSGAGLETLTKEDLAPYRHTIESFYITRALNLVSIEAGAFANMSKLEYVDIYQAPRLKTLNYAFTGLYPQLRQINIQETGLLHWPDMSRFKQEQEIIFFYFGFNKVESLGNKPINIRTRVLFLGSNQIEDIGENTFSGSSIIVLSLADNKRLVHIHPNAFVNLANLKSLDVSGTGLLQLPSAGMHKLRVLHSERNLAMKQIPPIHHFPLLKYARLTYAYHCCAFRYPKEHNLTAYEEHLQTQEKIRAYCAQKQSNNSSALLAYKNVSKELAEIDCKKSAGDFSSLPFINCTPKPDAFNPCEDIMGYRVLRVAVWLVVITSVLGNTSVILVQSAVFKRRSVVKFLQLNLAIADLFMGLYLAMLAIKDFTTKGEYFNSAIDWQRGLGCQIAGSLSLLSSQLSIFTLAVITFERYYTIKNTMDLNKRLKFGQVTCIMLIGWLFAITCAMLPIFADINSYNKTSICKPMRNCSTKDRSFILAILAVDSLAFLLIITCYLKMYLMIMSEKNEAARKQRTMATRMALLVLTDFACCAPTVFFGTTAVMGRPLISVTNTKIFLVFFYPLNAMANPFLYALTTRSFRRDVYQMIKQWHLRRSSSFELRHNQLRPNINNNQNYNNHHKQPDRQLKRKVLPVTRSEENQHEISLDKEVAESLRANSSDGAINKKYAKFCTTDL